MIDSVVKDIFCSYGDTSKVLKKRIEECLSVNLNKFDLIDYNGLVAKTINDNLIKQVNLQPILDLTQDIVGFVNKKEITLNEIAQLFIDCNQEENSNDGEGEITFIIEEEIKSYGDYVYLYADINKDVDKNKCLVRMYFNKKEGRMYSFRTQDYIYKDRIKEVTPELLSNFNQLQHKLFRLYSSSVKVDFSNMNVDTYWSRY